MSDATAFVYVAITIRGTDGLPLEEATSALTVDTWPEGGAKLESGYRPSFAIPRTSLGNGGTMRVACPGYVDRTARVITPFHPETEGLRVENEASKKETTAEAAYAVMDQEFICQLQHTEPPIPPVIDDVLPLAVDDKWFRTQDGKPWTQTGCTDFRLFERFLRGEDIDQVLAERANLGFNQLRVLLTCDLMFHLYPQEHADYDAQLVQFIQKTVDYKLRLELVVFADATRVMPRTFDQQHFFARVCDVARSFSSSVFLELVNENEQSINTIDTNAFSQPEGLISSHGSKGVVDTGTQEACVMLAWSYGTLHPARPSDWPRLGGHNTMEDVADRYGKPGTDNESCRPDQGRGPIPSDWFDAAANITLLCAGGTFHSNSGKDSVLLSPAEHACAEAWIQGVRAVPLDYQRGAYIAGHLTGYPIEWTPSDSSRAHGRLVGRVACLSLPQMRQGYVPVARPGWQITRQTGSVVEVQALSTRTAQALLEESQRDRRRE